MTGWEGFFPYYAGFPEAFARSLITSAKLQRRATVLDPWNGSGTTTYAASQLGHSALGTDINPVMVVVARARLLVPSEADSIRPLGAEIIARARDEETELAVTDPLLAWFTSASAQLIRSVEQSIRKRLVGTLTLSPSGVDLDNLSSSAATFYTALFAACRELTAKFRSSNPTWLRYPSSPNMKVSVSAEILAESFARNLDGMATALGQNSRTCANDFGLARIRLADTTSEIQGVDPVDLVLTSPPYCTRIDYTAATRVQLAIMAPLAKETATDLSRRMVGSTRVPKNSIQINSKWGSRCCDFLEKIRNHPSKASAGYYLKTHLDYFDKMYRSLGIVSSILKDGGAAVFVVQDSYYKDIHNDLPSIIADMATAHGLALRRRVNFPLSHTIAACHQYGRTYRQATPAVESVLCLSKH